jgi:probable F420-dependent oxidoreductase
VTRSPTLTVSLPTFGAPPAGGWRGLLDLGRVVEDAGVDRVVVTDHVVMGPNTDAYVWGRFPTPPEAPWLEPLTVLTGLAAVTERLRLATGVLIAPLRPAALLAKQVATLDQLAGGRVDLGVGVGWQREEYEAEGLDFAGRGRLLTDTIGACRALWERTPADFTSPSTSFADVYLSPKPAQERLPVWFGGTLHDRMLRRVVELGDGWIPIMGSTVDDIRAGSARLREAFAEAGRDPAGLSVQGALPLVRGEDRRVDLARSAARAPALVDARATDLIVHLGALCPDGAGAGSVLQELTSRLATEVGR